MPHLINPTNLTLPASIHYNASEIVLAELAKRFDFDAMTGLSGDFNLTQKKDYYILEGNYSCQLTFKGQDISIKESINLLLLTSQTQEAQFDITDDVEILENDTFDLEDFLAQSLFLEVCYFQIND